MTLKNNRAPLLSNIKLYASFHYHMSIPTGVTVRKRLSWVVTSVTLTFDLWPWPFAWTSLWSLVITPENFMMIRWWKHSQKGVTDRQTDGQTENTICRAAWSQLKIFPSIRALAQEDLWGGSNLANACNMKVCLLANLSIDRNLARAFRFAVISRFLFSCLVSADFEYRVPEKFWLT